MKACPWNFDGPCGECPYQKIIDAGEFRCLAQEINSDQPEESAPISQEYAPISLTDLDLFLKEFFKSLPTPQVSLDQEEDRDCPEPNCPANNCDECEFYTVRYDQ